jgi:hypothetical protein
MLVFGGAACGKAAAEPVPNADAVAAADWSWLTQEFPDVKELRPLEETLPLRDALLAWALPGQSTTVYDRACRPLNLRRDDDGLHGIVNERVKVDGNTKTRWYDEIVFSNQIELFCSNMDTYERTNRGGWTKDSSSGSGCAEMVGYILSDVSQDAAWYNGATVSVSFECDEPAVDAQDCADGTSRECKRCKAWGVWLEGRGQGPGFSKVTKTVRSKSTGVDCRAPCPAVAPPAKVTRAAAIVAGRMFLTNFSEDPPYLFRTRAACRSYTKQHPLSPEDRKPW